MPDILCLGEPLVEFNHTGGTQWRQGFGGDVSNVSVAAARQGASVGLVTRIGADGFGAMLDALWHGEGVDTRHVARDADAPTGLYFVTHGADGHAFEYRRAGSAASRMTPETLPPEVAQAAILHFSGITQAISPTARATAEAAAQAVQAAGGRVSFDPNLRLKLWPLAEARPAILGALAQCDIALPGLDDARALLEITEAEAIVRALLDMGPRIVALTMGRDGVLLGTGDGVCHIPSPVVTAVDATGAGDCFDGAFLARLQAGDTAAEAARYAGHAAALSTTDFGAIAPIPDAAAVHRAIAAAAEA